MRISHTFVLTCVVATLLTQSPPARAGDNKHAQPNIVLILADDLGLGDCGVYNIASKIPTPNIDRLARGGMRFSDAHSPSAVCTPTRYSIMTGTYAWRTRLKSGVLNGTSRSLLGDATTMAEFLQDRGYTTACIGKWHLGLGTFDAEDPTAPTDYSQPIEAGPHTTGFDHSFIIPASLDMPPYVYVEDGSVVNATMAHTPASKSRRSGGDGFWRAGAIAMDFEFDDVVPMMSSKAVSWLRSASSDGAPFFLYLPVPAPHTPWVPDAAFIGLSEAGYYGDFVAQLDAVVGRIMLTLEEQGVAENTLIVFTSDNGAHWTPNDIETYNHRANGSLRGQKADIHEGGHRVPFIVRWPGVIAPGTESRALIGLQDIFATIAASVGADEPMPPSARDSVSFLPALLGQQSARESLIHHSFDGMFAIRMGSWKLIEALGSGGFTPPKRAEAARDGAASAGQLYDLAIDPSESRNIFEEESQSERIAAMQAELTRIRQTAADSEAAESSSIKFND